MNIIIKQKQSIVSSSTVAVLVTREIEKGIDSVK